MDRENRVYGEPIVTIKAPFQSIYEIRGCTLPRLRPEDLEDLRDLVVELRDNVDMNVAADKVAHEKGQHNLLD